MNAEHWTRRTRGFLLVGILVVGAWLRLQGLNWDQGQHLHPDERFLTMVANDIRLPRSIGEYFDTSSSPLNPANSGHGFFVYGTFPVFLVRLIATGLGLGDYGRIHLVGRALSALFDLGTVWFTYEIALLLAGPLVGIAASALMTFSIFSIQQAHFFTVDSFAGFFTAVALLMLLRLALGGGLRSHLLFGIAFGLTLACRVNLLLLGVLYPVVLAYVWLFRRGRLAPLFAGAAAASLLTALVFRVFQPYAFTGPGFFDVHLAPGFLRSMNEIRAFATGAADYPPSVQWIGRLPVLFAGRNLLVWGLGPAWGIGAALGVSWCVLRRSTTGGGIREEIGLGRIVVLWAIGFFLYHSSQFAATGRYFLPILPVLALATAWSLGTSTSPARKLLLAVVVVLTAAWALAFTAIYRRPHSRVEASRWIYDNVKPGSTIANEHWDDGLPLGLEGGSPQVYRRIELKLYDDENEQKRQHLIAALDAADLLVLSSNRLYRSIPRTPWRYPMARRYYELLFAGDLGFRLERAFTSYPRLGPVEIPDEGAEEAFTVYDHPRVLIFRKTEAYSHDRVASLLNAVSLTGIVHVSPREASVLYHRMQPTEISLVGEERARTAVANDEISSVGALIRWLLAFELLSWSLFALFFRPLRATRDRGYGLAKIMAWLAPGYAVWLLGSTGLAPNTAEVARGVATLLIVAGARAAWRQRGAIIGFWRRDRRAILAVEAIFLVVFAIFVTARAFNPAIFWGEKPMDFAMLNAGERSRMMPPADPWFAGEPLNYFYFGHALAAIFAKLSGVPPAFGFNLALPTVAAALATAAFLFGYEASGRIATGVVTAFAVALLGNLAGARLFLTDRASSLDFNYFWATSRVIAGTINEFPFWNLIFADLHAHVLAMPFEVALFYLGILWAARGDAGERPSRLLVAILVAWFLGAVAVTSSWSLPTVFALQLGFLITAWRQRRGGVFGLAGVILLWLCVFLASRALFLPFWWSFRAPGRNWGWLTTETAPLPDMLTVFGVFVIAAVPVLLGDFGAWIRERRWRLILVALGLSVAGGAAYLRSLSCGFFLAWALLSFVVWLWEEDFAIRAGALLIGTAGAIGTATEIFFVWDRMNTVFKYYLEMWLMLGCGAALLGWSALQRLRGWKRPVWAVTLATGVIAGTFTSVSGAAGFLRTPQVASQIPSLDGMNYLRRQSPGEGEAFQWLNREIAGVPVLLEAHGPPYQRFSRVSMNTGLPTVLGWEYHLFQQAHPREEIEARARDVQELYSTTDFARAEHLLRKYHIDLVFVGQLERETYPTRGLAKFADWPLLQTIFRNPEVTIYATPGITQTAKTWIDKVPPSAPTAPPAVARLSRAARRRDGARRHLLRRRFRQSPHPASRQGTRAARRFRQRGQRPWGISRSLRYRRRHRRQRLRRRHLEPPSPEVHARGTLPSRMARRFFRSSRHRGGPRWLGPRDRQWESPSRSIHPRGSIQRRHRSQEPRIAGRHRHQRQRRHLRRRCRPPSGGGVLSGGRAAPRMGGRRLEPRSAHRALPGDRPGRSRLGHGSER